MSQMHTHPDLSFDLIDRLHKSLRLSGKSAVALAADLGVHRNTVNNYLSGKSAVDRRTLIAWALVTGVPLAWLEHGMEAPNPGPDGGAEDDWGSVDAVAKLAASKRNSTHRRTTGRYLPFAA